MHIHSPGDSIGIVPKKSSGPCFCTTLRRAARAVTIRYDNALADTGLTITQHSLLVRIGDVGRIVHSVLAQAMGMDRTTLTRALAPLSRRGLIQSGSSDDRRQHVLQLTPAGSALVERAHPLWERAQQSTLDQLGKKRWRRLQELLEAIDG